MASGSAPGRASVDRFGESTVRGSARAGFHVKWSDRHALRKDALLSACCRGCCACSVVPTPQGVVRRTSSARSFAPYSPSGERASRGRCGAPRVPRPCASGHVSSGTLQHVRVRRFGGGLRQLRFAGVALACRGGRESLMTSRNTGLRARGPEHVHAMDARSPDGGQGHQRSEKSPWEHRVAVSGQPEIGTTDSTADLQALRSGGIFGCR